MNRSESARRKPDPRNTADQLLWDKTLRETVELAISGCPSAPKTKAKGISSGSPYLAFCEAYKEINPYLTGDNKSVFFQGDKMIASWHRLLELAIETYWLRLDWRERNIDLREFDE